MSNPIRPSFTLETALAKVQAAEDTWNGLDPHRDSLAYTENSEWRNRAGIKFLRRLARAGAEIRCPSGPVARVLVGSGVRVVLDAEPAARRRPP